MKKFLRFIVILLAVVIAAVLILAAVEPTDVIVSRTVMIKAPKNVVFEQIVFLKNFNNWSPWTKLEPSKVTYSGTDGQPGGSFHWVGGSKTGEGEMTIKAINGTQMDYDLAFLKPREGKATGFFKADDSAGMTKTTWSVSMHMGFPWNAMLVFMNMDKMLGGDFESGLNNLKIYTEGHAEPVSDVEIKEVDFPGHTYLGVRQTVNWANLNKFFADTREMVGKEAGPKINGAPIGVFYTWDAINKSTDVFAGFPMYDTTKPVKGASFLTVATSKAYMAVEKGGYSNGMKYHNALGKYIAEKGKHPSLVIEEYTISDHQEPDSNKWVTNIYYLVQ